MEEKTRYFGVLFSNEKILFRQVGENEWERYDGDGEWTEVKGAKTRHEAIGTEYIEIDERIARGIIFSIDDEDFM